MSEGFEPVIKLRFGYIKIGITKHINGKEETEEGGWVDKHTGNLIGVQVEDEIVSVAVSGDSKMLIESINKAREILFAKIKRDIAEAKRE